MKKILTILVFFLFHAYICNAQNNTVSDSNKVEKLKREYLAQQLKLSNSESKAFWSVYTTYNIEIRAAWRESSGDETHFREKAAIIKDKYRPEFISVLHSHERANDVYRAEKDYRAMLKKTLQERKK